MADGQHEPDARHEELRLSFAERLRSIVQRVAIATPNEAVHVVCVAVLAATAGTYPDPGLWHGLGLGVVTNFAADWLKGLRAGRVPRVPDVPEDIAAEVVSDQQARQALLRLAGQAGLLADGMRELEPAQQEHIGGLLRQALQEPGVAHPDDVQRLTEALPSIEIHSVSHAESSPQTNISINVGTSAHPEGPVAPPSTQPLGDSRTTDIEWGARDSRLLRDYFDRCARYDPLFEQHAELDEESVRKYFVASGLAGPDRQGRLCLTEAGVLLCCKHDMLPRHLFHVHVKFEMGDLADELFGSVLHLYGELYQRLTPLFSRPMGSPGVRDERGGEALFYDYPQAAVVEALVNFLIHRDYSQDDIGFVMVGDDYVEFMNPGTSIIPVEKLMTATDFLKPRYVRNPRLIEAMNKARLNQRKGGGILMIRQELKKNRSFLPGGSVGLSIENDEEKQRFTLVLHKRPPVAHDHVAPSYIGPASNVPSRNPNFTGREEELKSLRDSLVEGGTAALTQAITGLGGVGKTQLAIEYATRHRDDYQVVWWVVAETPAQLAEDFAALAKSLDLPEKDEQDQRIVTQAVCRWLAGHGGWLLVFDNAPDAESLTDYLPGDKGHVIITSRDPEWSVIAKEMPVAVWPRNESIEFLGKRIGRRDDPAGDLAEELGDLPLALEQAAAYIKRTGSSLEDYLKLYRDRREALWPDEKPPLGYSHTVGTTWTVAMEGLEKEEPAAAELLNLLAFLAPDDIPRDLFAKGAEHLPDSLAKVVTDELALNPAIAALRHYSLITAEGDALSLHRLVQAVTRDRLSEEERGKWAAATVRLLNAAFPFDQYDPATWEESGRLLPHALVAAGHAEALHVATEETGNLLNQAGTYLWRRAEFAAAKAAFERALAIDEKAYGPDHPEVARDVNNLGTVLQDIGDLAGAREHYERALAVDEKAYGPDHPKVAIRVNNLGSVLQDMGDLKGAKEHYERALAVFEKTHGKEHPQVATAANNLGNVLQDMGDLKGAKEHFERALTIFEQAYGSEHPQVATAANNLGDALQDMGDLEGAREHYERALGIDEKAYGPDHPNVAIRVANLADVAAEMGDLKGARAYYERALAIFRQFLGDDHPQTHTVRAKLEEFDKAESL